MKREKKIWSAPIVVNLDGSEVALGTAPIPEGMHMSGSPMGSSFFGS